MDVLIAMVIVGLIFWALASWLRGLGQPKETPISGESVGSYFTRKAGAQRRHEARNTKSGSPLGSFNSILDEGMQGSFLPSVQAVWNSLDEETVEKLGMILGPEFARQMNEFTAMKGEAISTRQKMELEQHLRLISLRLAGNKAIPSINAKIEMSRLIGQSIVQVKAIEDPLVKFFALAGVCDELAQFANATMPTLGEITARDVMKLATVMGRNQQFGERAYREAIEDVMFSGVPPSDIPYGDLYTIYRAGLPNNGKEEKSDG